MHVWEQVDGKNQHRKERWTPYVFVKTDKGKFKSIFGDTAEIKQFKKYYDYKEFGKANYTVFENQVKPEIQYLAEKYHPVEDKDIVNPELLSYFVDIEVAHVNSFPKAELAKHPVCLISVRNSQTNKTVTFGEKEYAGNTEGVIYVHCPNEKELLRKFFAYMNKYPPHVLSGYNIMGFDLPYLINRDKKINSGTYYNGLSPINIVRTWESKKDQKMNIDIAGVAILDYMDVYKWYSPHNLERYSLEYVSNFELGEGKLKHEGDLRDLYNSDWNTYVDYNVMDSQRVHELDRKLGYINLTQTVSLLTRAPMKYYNVTTALIEGVMLTYYRRNNLCAPPLLGGSQKWYEAAYVKEPQVGMHSWLYSIDIQSSYPSHIIALNMSNETYFGRVTGLSEDEIIRHSANKDFPSMKIMKPAGIVSLNGKKLKNFNIALKKKMFSIAPCGTIFVNKKTGVIANVVRDFFEKRIEVKKLMKQSEGEEKERYWAIQQVFKVNILNSIYGTMAVPYSRYFNTDMAEAVTSCGRHTIKSGEKFTNEIMNDPDEGLVKLLEEVKND